MRSSSVIWPVVHHERQTLINDLEKLSPDQWFTSSLCSEWDIHDLVAHLVDGAKTTRLGFIRQMTMARFDFDRATAAGVVREKTLDPASTLTKFQAVARSTATPPAALATRLVEAYIHGEDIRRPLGIVSSYDPAHVATALEYQVKTTEKIGGAKELANGYRLVATDTEFQYGQGPELHGTALTLLLAFSWRQVTSAELTGPGATAFFAARAGKYSF